METTERMLLGTCLSVLSARTQRPALLPHLADVHKCSSHSASLHPTGCLLQISVQDLTSDGKSQETFDSSVLAQILALGTDPLRKSPWYEPCSQVLQLTCSRVEAYHT